MALGRCLLPLFILALALCVLGDKVRACVTDFSEDNTDSGLFGIGNVKVTGVLQE